MNIHAMSFNLGTDTVTKVTKIAEIVKEELGYLNAKIKIEGTRRAWPEINQKYISQSTKLKNLAGHRDFIQIML